jgi:hypothetical protein
MAHSYDIINDFHVKATDAEEALTSSPDWCMAVVRFQNPLTYDRAKRESFSTLFHDGVQIRGKPLIVRDECAALQVTSTKASHLTQLTASILPNSGTNFLAEILPGDWIFAWMAHDSTTIDTVIKNVLDGKSANGFMDGLKFMGRVGAVRKIIQQSPGGVRMLQYSINATGFTEFDATLFYEPHLAANVPALGLYFANLGTQLDQLISNAGQGINVNLALRTFLDLLLGQGVTTNLGLPSSDRRLRSTAGLDSPYSYVVPKEVGAVIGKTTKSKPDLLSAADCLEFIYGRQEYNAQKLATLEIALADSSSSHDPGAVARGFSPDGTRGGGNRRFTGNDMLGIFLPTPPQFSSHSVWSILNQYLNPAVNEMYTCLRANPQGDIVPTLVARQLPFSTEQAPATPTSQQAAPPVTKFLSLPRWKVHPILVRKADIGRSDAMRINFVHVYGDDGPQTMNPVGGQIVLAPPYRDDLDIARSGLKPYMQTIANAPVDNVDGESAKKWMAILADILMGQQLTLTGLLEIYGVQAPICPGDNLEWDDTVFHLESVSHSCSIDPAGLKAFVTTCALSHGLSISPGKTNLSLFTGLDATSLTTHNPGLTNEGHDYNTVTTPAKEGEASARRESQGSR